jgi:hypothetical protein
MTTARKSPRGLLVAAALGLATSAPQAGRADQLEVVPLKGLVATDGELVLNGAFDSRDFPLWLGEGAEVSKAALKLAYVASDRLVPARSSLEVLLNGTALAKLPVAGDKKMLRAEVALPAGLLQPGRNLLTVVGRQEHVAGCGEPVRPEMWT